jgi:hypothetical protein
MKKAKFFVSLILSISILMIPVGGVFAAAPVQDSTLLTGKVHRITLDTDPSTAITTVIVELVGQGHGKQIVRISQETAVELRLIMLDVDGPVINPLALGTPVEIDAETLIPDEPEDRHPVANALATFFSDVADEETLYTSIMAVHEDGVGFGVIAQALWLTLKLEADSQVFELILDAREKNDYGELYQYFEDGVMPTNWGQLRKAILTQEKKSSVGTVISNNTANGNGQSQDKEKGKDKENNGAGNGENSNKDKDKEKKQ